MATLAEIYDWFMTGKKPTQAQFWASWGSFWNKNESIPQSAVSNLTTVLNAKAEKSQFDAHKTDPDAHTEALGEKLDKDGYEGTAQDIDNRITAIENPDRVLKFGTITLTGLDVTIAANAFAWVLNKLSYLTPAAFSQTIMPATVGMYRNDIVVGNDFGGYEIVQGPEGATGGAAAEPPAPAGTIKLGFISLFGNTVTSSGSAPAIEKATIVDADRIVIDDSADSFSKKSVKWSSIKTTLKTWFDTVYKTWFLSINAQSGITYTFQTDDYKKRTVFTNTNPVALTVPTNAVTPFAIGTKLEFTQKGDGVVTLGGAGITFTTNLSLSMVKGETRTITKIGTDEWTVQGNIQKGILPTDVNSFTVLQKFKAGAYLVDEQGTTSDGTAIANTEGKRLLARTNPSNTDTSNPRMYDIVAQGRMASPGWYGGINLICANNSAELILASFYLVGGATKKIDLFGDLTVSGNLSVSGSLVLAFVNLTRNSNSILNAGTYNALTYNINGVISSPYRIVEDRVQAGGGPGWHSKRIFYVKSNNDVTDRIAIEMISQDNGIPIINLPGIVRPAQMNLSDLGSYANDSAAATGGVPVGYGYINSSTGAVQRRLT